MNIYVLAESDDSGFEYDVVTGYTIVARSATEARRIAHHDHDRHGAAVGHAWLDKHRTNVQVVGTAHTRYGQSCVLSRSVRAG